MGLTKDIVFMAVFGEKEREVKIVQPHLSGDVYQVLIDDFYQGVIMKRGGQWEGYWNPNSVLTADDVQILADLIVENGG